MAFRAIFAAAGLLAALTAMPAMGANPDWAHAKQIDEITTEYKFSPAQLQFHIGVPYRLHLVNRGKETHEFHAPEFFAAITMRDQRPLNADHTEIVVQPGRQSDLYFVATKPGRFPLICSDHDWAGMTGGITIK
ncbi:MAG TPA: cupredoxin domain-containing protein [Stellaceae bacterium]|jgi:uncharacterized cupredoxin-like copper-binding protein